MLLNTMSVSGQVLLGILIDRMHVTNVILISPIGDTLSIFGLWGLAASLPLLCVFSLSYRLFAGGFTSTWICVIREVQKREKRAEAGPVFGLLSAGRGIGSVLSGTLSAALLNNKLWARGAGLGYSTGYGGLIVFTGVSATLGDVSWMGEEWEGFEGGDNFYTGRFSERVSTTSNHFSFDV